MANRKKGSEYDKWHKRVEGQIRDCMASHPEYFADMDKRTRGNCINSLAKRIVGEIVSDKKNSECG